MSSEQNNTDLTRQEPTTPTIDNNDPNIVPGIESELNLLDAESTGTAEVLSHSPRATHTISLPLSTGSQTTMPTVNSITPVQLPSPQPAEHTQK